MNKLVTAHIQHTRTEKANHSFSLRHFFFLLDLSELDTLVKYWPFYRFKKEEHFALEKKLSPLQSIQDLFPEVTVSKVLLLTNLNTFGYHFNPLSAYFIFEGNQHSHTLYEVGNTFGEQKLYKAKGSAPLRVQKEFYVSPFIPLHAQFEFKALLNNDNISLVVKSSDKGATILTASLQGKVKQLTPKSLLLATLAVPFAPLKVIITIHFHALRLFIKKIPYNKKNQNIENQKGVLHGPRPFN